MGGPGSGRWWRCETAKATVDESLTLALKNLPRTLVPGLGGGINWTSSSGHNSSIGYTIIGTDKAPIIVLEYTWRRTEQIRVPIHLTSTPTYFGGKRWWFVCPLIVNGSPCQRRVGKVHHPPGSRYFGCRKCHNLSYLSSQQAHQAERVFGRLGLNPEEARLLSKRSPLFK